jgi:muconolactone delta-isomerase
MKILALEKEIPGAAAEDFRSHLIAEAARAWELHQAGLIRELYFHRDEHSAVLVLECESVEEAEQALNSLPLVQAGLICFELIPLVPYNGFARLFAGENS